MSGRLSVPLVISGALAGLFVMAGVAFASHPFGALNNTGNTASTGFRVPMGAASKPCRAADQGGAPDSTHSGVPGDSCSGSGASRLTSNLVKPGPKRSFEPQRRNAPGQHDGRAVQDGARRLQLLRGG
jgi:hypothetical protein